MGVINETYVDDSCEILFSIFNSIVYEPVAESEPEKSNTRTLSCALERQWWNGRMRLKLREKKTEIGRGDGKRGHFEYTINERHKSAKETAILLQNGRPIDYRGRNLFPAGKNHVQIGKEMLAIVFTLERFHTYPHGRRTVVQTDHERLSLGDHLATYRSVYKKY